MLYFISDTHFSHENIIKYCDRPFRDKTNMNIQLMKNWNDVVGENDTVLHLGDFSLSLPPKNFDMIYNNLNGKMVILKGNHDNHFKRFFDKEKHDRWKLVEKTRFSMEIKGYKIVFSHRPVKNENILTQYDYNFHGHVHNNSRRISDKHINLSLENIGYRPVSFEWIKDNFEI